jgi:hypothetical protein
MTEQNTTAHEADDKLTERELEVDAFYDAAERLIEHAPEELAEAARAVITHLAVTFGLDTRAEDARLVKGWAEMLGREVGSEATLQIRRARCVDAVHKWGARVKEDPAQRRAYAEALVDDLKRIGTEVEEYRITDDPKDDVQARMRKACPWAEAWRNELDDVAAKLDSYDPEPARKKGKKSAEVILTEMILDGGEFLGLSLKDGEGEKAAITRIRGLLFNAVRENPDALDHAPKRL